MVAGAVAASQNYVGQAEDSFKFAMDKISAGGYPLDAGRAHMNFQQQLAGLGFVAAPGREASPAIMQGAQETASVNWQQATQQAMAALGQGGGTTVPRLRVDGSGQGQGRG